MQDSPPVGSTYIGSYQLTCERGKYNWKGCNTIRPAEFMMMWKQEGKRVCFYVAEYPVWNRSTRFTLLPPPLAFQHQLDFSGKHSSHAAITPEDYSLIFPQLYIARYSFIQLIELGREQNVAKGIRTRALDCESGNPLQSHKVRKINIWS